MFFAVSRCCGDKDDKLEVNDSDLTAQPVIDANDEFQKAQVEEERKKEEEKKRKVEQKRRQEQEAKEAKRKAEEERKKQAELLAKQKAEQEEKERQERQARLGPLGQEGAVLQVHLEKGWEDCGAEDLKQVCDHVAGGASKFTIQSRGGLYIVEWKGDTGSQKNASSGKTRQLRCINK
mmetsp:Transcript_23512/g.41336  ORF Transcript_23512/g.41336 Transcript_23512/m.41336 type:complete len:178 (-) Transcript_23512:45-578(-)